MDKKTYKYRFIKKNSPKLEKNKTLEHHYSKIICSIFDRNKEKKKEEKKIIDKEKKEKDITFNLSYSKKLFPFRNKNKFKDLFLVPNHSSANYFKNYESFLNKKEAIINKKNKKSPKAYYTKSNVTKNKSISKENNKNLEKILYNNKKPNITYDVNMKIKNKISKETKSHIYYSKNKGMVKNNSNKIKLLYLSNLNNNSNKFISFNLSSFTDIKKSHVKKIYISSGLNNSESFINNKIYKKTIQNNKSKSNTPINAYRDNIKKPSKVNNTTITNYKKNIHFTEIINKKTKNKKQKIIPRNIFCKKNNINKGKRNILNIKERVRKLDLSSISLNNSSSSGAIDSKKIRSFSKKRNEKKMMNFRENELYTEKANIKINNLYEIIKEYENDMREKPSLKIKLIDKIRRDKKINSIFIKTE
jgi:hypothetical protein